MNRHRHRQPVDQQAANRQSAGSASLNVTSGQPSRPWVPDDSSACCGGAF